MEGADDGNVVQTLLPHVTSSSTGSVARVPGRCAARERWAACTVLDVETATRKGGGSQGVQDVIKTALVRRWARFSLKKQVYRKLPLVKTLRRYQVSWLVRDAVAGVTVAVMVVPQALAFALVAGLPPIVGLYIALFSSLVYCLLGTGKHLSWNCVAVLAIMMGNLLDKYDPDVRRQLQPNPLVLQRGGGAGGGPGAKGVSGGSTGAEGLAFQQLQQAKTLFSDDNVYPIPPQTRAEGSTLGTNLAFPTERPAKTPVGAAEGTLAPSAGTTGGSEDDLSSQRPRGGANSSEASLDASSGPPSGGGGAGGGAESLERLVTQRKLELAASVTFMSGVIMVALGQLGLGRVASFMSDSLVISFTVGVSFHVLVGQLVTALGLHLPAHSGAFKIFRLSADIFSNVHRANPATVGVFLVSCVVMYSVKRFVNEKFAHRLKVPVPVELVVVMAVTGVNAALRLNESHAVDVVAHIPLGLPRPRLPDLSAGLPYLGDGLVISLISFTQTVALGKMMALKHGYRLDANQEMLSLGAASLLVSLFSGFVPGASITCTVVMDSAGARTQVAALCSSLIVLLVVMFLGPYFYFLPQSVLAAIIVVNIRSMFLKLATVPALWRKSRADGLVWVSTCLLTVVLDTDLGLLGGLAVCLLGVLLRARRTPVTALGRAQRAGNASPLWRSVAKYRRTRELPGVKVLRLNCDLYFVNAELVSDLIVKKSGIDPKKLIKKERLIVVEDPLVTNTATDISKPDTLNPHILVTPTEASTRTSSLLDKPNDDLSKIAQTDKLMSSKNDEDSSSTDWESVTGDSKDLPLRTLVLDFGGTSFIDIMGVEALERVASDYEAMGIDVYVANLSESCVQTLLKTGFLEKHRERVYTTVDDVVAYLRSCDTA